MAPKSVTFRRHDHLVSVLFGDLLSHSYNITFSMFLYLVTVKARQTSRDAFKDRLREGVCTYFGGGCKSKFLLLHVLSVCCVQSLYCEYDKCI